MQEYLDSLLNVYNLSEVDNICKKLASACGFDDYFYVKKVFVSLSRTELVLLSGCDVDLNVGFLSTLITSYERKIQISQWDYTNHTNSADPLVLQSLNQGYTFGMCFPYSGEYGQLSILSLFSKNNLQEKEKQNTFETMRPLGIYAACCIDQAISRITRNQAQDFKITKREKQCLLWAAEGKTSYETSIILGTKERTINFHIQNAMNKLKATNRQHAVAKAITHSIISTSDSEFMKLVY